MAIVCSFMLSSSSILPRQVVVRLSLSNTSLTGLAFRKLTLSTSVGVRLIPTLLVLVQYPPLEKVGWYDTPWKIKDQFYEE